MNSPKTRHDTAWSIDYCYNDVKSSTCRLPCIQRSSGRFYVKDLAISVNLFGMGEREYRGIRINVAGENLFTSDPISP